MTFPEAQDAAIMGAKITRPGREGHWLAFSDDAGLILNSEDKTKTPCRWTPMPGDAEAGDWFTIGPARAEIGRLPGAHLRVSAPPSLPKCLYCGHETLLAGDCKSCRHQLMLVVAPGVVGAAYRTSRGDSDAIARDVGLVVSALMGLR